MLVALLELVMNNWFKSNNKTETWLYFCILKLVI